jgi:uncharacterized protein YerC
MHVSNKYLNSSLNKQIRNSFFQLISDIKNPDEAKTILSGLLTETEIEIFSKRLAIGYYLKSKRNYENVSNNLKVSSTTIARVSEMMKNNGFELALKKIGADDWAEKWSRRIKKLVR